MSNWRTLSRSLGAVMDHLSGGREGKPHSSPEGRGATIGRRMKRAKDRAEAAKGGRAALRFGGGRTDLLEELGRVEGERSNPNRRAEISRVHGELNRGYKDGGRIGFKKGTDKKWIQKATASIKKRGTKGKCTPITKPGCTGRAKALAKTFKKMAAKRKA